ncbi:MAG TPA: hypothetical protein VF136_05700, partial [Methylomirabilota bacterium]
GTAVLMAFSGGLDSCFTAWRQTRGECGRARRQVRAAVMVHGFDIPLTQPEVFTRAAENSRRLLESIGLALIPVTCNFRQLGGDWEDAHGAALASCLHLLGGGYSAGLVAGSHAYEGLRFPWGSNPLTDPMLSSGTFQLVYDAAGFSRPEKARGVSGWPEAMQRLRVCWEGPQKDRNCGRCLRCVGTALCFAAIGIEPPDVLNVGPLGRAVSGLAYQPIKPASLLRLGELLDLARASDIDAPWMRALERLLRLGRRRARLARVLPPVRVPWQYYRLSKVLRRLAIPVQP